MMTRRFEQEGISPVVAQEEQTRRGLAALWAGRGWWGGLIACGLAALGQDALIGHGDEPGAGRFYLAAAVVLIVALFHPAWPWRRRAPDELPVLDATKPLPARTAVVETGNGHAPTNGSTAATANGVDHAAALAVGETTGAPPAVLVRKVRGANGAQPVIVASTTAVATVPVPAAPARPQLAAWVPGAPAAPARRDARSVGPVGRPAAPGIGSGTGDAAPVAPAGPWGRWQATRARLGWRVTVPGLVLTAALAGLSASLLLKEIADPAGGWLWAAALITLLLTFVGAPGWPSGAGLLEGPEDDFFSRGVPRLSPRLEWALVAGLMIVALALRLWNLEYMPGIFGDEGERGMDARAINNGNPALLFGYGWWGVPNLYFYCVAAMLRLFGDTMVGDRMLSVISGAVAVFYVYRIGRLFWGPRAGLLAGALLAVSPLALQFSRLAGESTPTGALWAVGFYYLFRALRYRTWSDWVLGGVFCGFSLYFYAAGKLIIPLLGLIGLYCLVRWHINFFKRYLLGFVLAGVAFLLTFMPYALFSVKDNWQGFTGRAQETSIFSPQNMPQAFAKYGVPFDPAQVGQPLVTNVLTHLGPWTQVVFEQMKVTTAVIYRSGDPTPFYQIQEHGGSMLPPLWAALALLGLAYGVWKFWDGRFALAGLWFWGGMLGAALTMDTPSVQRLTGAWPVIMLFPAALLDRVWAGAWPISGALARRWATVPLAGLLVFFGTDGSREYFGHYATLCPYCDGTTQARYAQALGQDYKGYQLGVGGYDIFFSYGSTRFVAKGVEGADLAVPADFFPVIDNKGKGAAFLIYGPNADYLPIIRLFYPEGTEEDIKSVDGVHRFTSYKITKEQMAGIQALTATYTPPGGAAVTRAEPNLGTSRAADVPGGPWAPPADLAYPAAAAWDGAFVAPSYGLYTFTLKGDGKLTIDGRLVLDAAAATESKLPAADHIELVLAKGIHDVRLTGTLATAAARVDVLWGPTGGTPTAMRATYLYHGAAGLTGGLSAEVWSGSPPSGLAMADPSGGQPVKTRRNDPVWGFREDTVTFGNAPFFVRWRGTLNAPAEGSYTFQTSSNGPSLLQIDGQIVVNNPANNSLGMVPGTVQLTAGPHTVDLRYAWQGGPGRMEWYWTPPGGQSALVPPTVLAPEARSWPRGAVPDPTDAPGNVAAPPPPPVTTPPDAVLATDAGLKEPRGIGVLKDGQLFVADSGSFRVVHLDAGGKVVGTWGSETKTSAPGKFGTIADLAITPEGNIATLDVTTGDVQVFAPDGKVLLQIPAAAPNSSGIAVGPDGRIWVANTSSSRILRFTPDGKPDGELTGGADGTRGKFEQPIDVAVAPDGTAYVVDLRGRILRLDAQGNTAAEWPVEWGGARGGSHLAVAGDKVIMTDPDRHRLDVLDPATGEIHVIGGPGKDPGQFRLPVGIAAGAGGKVYVVDSDNSRVQVFHDLK